MFEIDIVGRAITPEQNRIDRRQLVGTAGGAGLRNDPLGRLGIGRATLWRKFKGGPGTYEGLFELLERTYRALSDGSRLPVSPELVLGVNRLIDALKPEGSAA